MYCLLPDLIIILAIHLVLCYFDEHCFVYLLYDETGFYFVAQASLTLLPQPSYCWDYRHESLWLAVGINFFDLWTIYAVDSM